jgi:hypothetical protein
MISRWATHDHMLNVDQHSSVSRSHGVNKHGHCCHAAGVADDRLLRLSKRNAFAVSGPFSVACWDSGEKFLTFTGIG